MQFVTEISTYVAYLAGGILSTMIAVYALRNLVWLLRYPFFLLNWIQWMLYNPIRDSWRHPRLGTANLAFNILMLTGITPLWWLMMHIALTPIRIINAIYFNIILYWSVIFCDSISELLHPKGEYHHPPRGDDTRRNYRQRGMQRTEKRYGYVRRWLMHFPQRLFNVFHRNGLALLEGILMTGVDTVFPTYTMFHGTAFKGIATNIASQGRWYVGGGDYAGSGIYFGLYRKTAEHYAKGDDHAMIVARVTLFPCRNSSTLPHRLRKKIGNDGTGISAGLGFPWKAVEHWRDHSYAQWFEYVLVQPGKAGEYVRTWRARPICILKHHLPSRIWGGLSLWTSGAGGAEAIIFAWVCIIGTIILYYKYLIYLP